MTRVCAAMPCACLKPCSALWHLLVVPCWEHQQCMTKDHMMCTSTLTAHPPGMLPARGCSESGRRAAEITFKYGLGVLPRPAACFVGRRDPLGTPLGTDHTLSPTGMFRTLMCTHPCTQHWTIAIAACAALEQWLARMAPMIYCLLCCPPTLMCQAAAG
jgi:hypothetical protein